MRVLVACEYSGRVRDAFLARGHDAVSCDLLPTESPGPHAMRDVRELLDNGWDLMIAHPPCTHLATSGARWFGEKQQAPAALFHMETGPRTQGEALDLVRDLLAAPIPRIALENPVSVISGQIRKPDQIIQPWQFGEGYVKATCLWLKGLPPLAPTQVVAGREAYSWKVPPGPSRARLRSRTYPGIAQAMADQWG